MLRDMDSRSPAREVSEGNKGLMMKWARSDSYHVLEKKLNLFCLRPENLGETEFTGIGLICSAEEPSQRVWWFE